MITIILVIICLSLLILIHELGHFLAAKFFKVRVDEFGLGFPPRIFGKKFGDTTYSINGLPFGGFVKIHGEDGDEAHLATDSVSFSSQSMLRKSLIVLAGIGMNIILGWTLLSAVFMIGAPEHLAISDVSRDTPAAVVGLRPGDIILKAQGAEAILTDPVKSESFINMVKGSLGKPISLQLKRGREIVSVTLSGRVNPPAGQGALGIGLVSIGFFKMPIFEAIGKGFKETGATLFFILKGLGALFTNFKSVSGPVGIVSIAAQTSAIGFVYLLQLMALISLNLAVLNLVPFPALDGGRFLFLLIEKIKGGPISKKFQAVANGLGFVLLIALMIAVTIQDIGRL